MNRICFDIQFSLPSMKHTSRLTSYKEHCNWRPHVVTLTCQEVLNSSDQRFAVSWSNKISFCLE